MKMSTESPRRLSFLLTPSTKPPSVYTEPNWPGRGEFRGALAGGPPEEDSPPAGSRFPEFPLRQLQGRAYLNLGPRPLPPAHIAGGAGSLPIPPHPTPTPGVSRSLNLRGGWFKPCVRIQGSIPRRLGQVGWRFGFSPWLPMTLSLSLPACKMGDNTIPLVAYRFVQLPAVVGGLGTPNGSCPAVSSLISRPVFLLPSSPP